MTFKSVPTTSKGMSAAFESPSAAAESPPMTF